MNKNLTEIANEAKKYFKQGNIFLEKENYNDALECFDKALEIKPNYVYALNNKGNLFYDQGKFEEALECYEKALEIKPKFIIGIINKAKALNHQGKFEESLKNLDEALAYTKNKSSRIYKDISIIRNIVYNKYINK